MSVSPEQLSEIHRQLRDSFDSHPAIAIKPLKGDPPEQYEIIYKISGYSKSGKGEPSLTQNHKIELTIPFGFPHFPPSCKPKSDIFHPDFDPAAICLGDFWHQHRKIPDLIIFIGKLINGESYSTSNAFNEQAATWYQKHSDTFPLAQIFWGGTPNDLADTQTQAGPSPHIDTLEDDDLSPDFTFLSMDSDSTDTEPPPSTFIQPIESGLDVDLDSLQLLKNQKKFFQLRRTIDKKSSGHPQVKKILARTEEVIAKAEELHRAAKKSEYQDNLQEAAQLYEQISSLVSDFPNLDADQRRIIQSLTLFDEFTKDSTSDMVASDFPSDSPKEIPENNHSNKRSQRSKSQTGLEEPRRDSFLPEKRVRGKFIAFTALGVICLILAGSGIFYFISIHSLDTASEARLQCASFIENQKFEAAKQACEEAVYNLDRVKFIEQGRVRELQVSVQQILQSEKLTQGLAGNILVDGKYMPIKDANTLNTYRQLIKEGEELFNQENWTQAEDRFTKILTLAGKNALLSASTTEDIKNKLSYTRFNIAFNSAKNLLTKQKWQEAAVELKRAQVQLETLPENDQRKYSVELNTALAKLNFEEFRKQGDEFFSKADWLNAISSYKSVLPSIEEGNIAPQATLDALRENITRAELYATMDKGNKAFATGSWDEAIDEYNRARSILADSSSNIKFADTKVTSQKINRIILQTALVRDRHAAKIQQEDKKDLTAARSLYKQIVATINKSEFANEDEFIESKKEALNTIQILDEKIYQADKEQYLKDNFRNLFVENYPAAVPENLNNPVISFVKETDGKMIFKMQCIETGRGRPLMLIMFYAYDKSRNHWSFFSEQQ